MYEILEAFQSIPFKIDLCIRRQDQSKHIYVRLFIRDDDAEWNRLCTFSAYQLTGLVDLLVKAINILADKYQKTAWGYKIKENKNDKD